MLGLRVYRVYRGLGLRGLGSRSWGIRTEGLMLNLRVN